MKFSMILAALPMALAATGTLKARDATREAASIAAREDACSEYRACVDENGPYNPGCNICECYPHIYQCRSGPAPFGY